MRVSHGVYALLCWRWWGKAVILRVTCAVETKGKVAEKAQANGLRTGALRVRSPICISLTPARLMACVRQFAGDSRLE